MDGSVGLSSGADLPLEKGIKLELTAKNRFNGKASDVAKFFGLSNASICKLAREGRLPAGSFAYLNGRVLRFDLSALRQWVADGGASSPLR
jgi:hypothetical protein